MSDAQSQASFAPSWVSEPDGRGTWKILYSCVTTLAFCVFTALHMNVGHHKEPVWRWWLRKFKWVAIGIISPEVILYTAGEQWFSAQRLCKKLNRWAISDGLPDPLHSKTRSPFDLYYGHYAVMGGFLVDVFHIHNSLRRLTLTPKAIAFLGKHGHFLQVSHYTSGFVVRRLHYGTGPRAHQLDIT